MSRIGKQSINLSGAEVRRDCGKLSVRKGGQVTELKVCDEIGINIQGDVLTVEASNTQSRPYQGLTRTLIDNAVKGMSSNFTISLDLVGVGYKVENKNGKLIFNLGYSHPIEFELPSGLECQIEKMPKQIQQYQTTLTIKGPNKEQVGQVAANLVNLRKPDAYKGKGLRYSAKPLVLKPGKSGGKGGKK